VPLLWIFFKILMIKLVETRFNEVRPAQALSYETENFPVLNFTVSGQLTYKTTCHRQLVNKVYSTQLNSTQLNSTVQLSRVELIASRR
jgi:hypothetical protein